MPTTITNVGLNPALRVPQQPQRRRALVEPIRDEERARFAALWPSMQRYGQQYGVNPRTIAALIRQESRFRNLRVHDDGTGHGLAGLDDNGLRKDFERWSGLYIGPGRTANVVSAEKQVEYVARRLGESKRRYGSEGAAVREWHRGAGNMNDARGQAYERLLRAHGMEIDRVIH